MYIGVLWGMGGCGSGGDEERAEVIQSLEDQVGLLKNEITKLTTQLGDLERKNRQYRDDFQEVSKELDRLKSEVTRLNNDIDRLQKKIEPK